MKKSPTGKHRTWFRVFANWIFKCSSTLNASYVLVQLYKPILKGSDDGVLNLEESCFLDLSFV
jgi:hypothetical protein